MRSLLAGWFSPKARNARRAEQERAAEQWERDRRERERVLLVERWDALRRGQPELADAAVDILVSVFVSQGRSGCVDGKGTWYRLGQPLSEQAWQWLLDNRFVETRWVYDKRVVRHGPHSYVEGPYSQRKSFCVSTAAREAIDYFGRQ
jgi:hypothetical protein